MLVKYACNLCNKIFLLNSVGSLDSMCSALLGRNSIKGLGATMDLRAPVP